MFGDLTRILAALAFIAGTLIPAAALAGGSKDKDAAETRREQRERLAGITARADAERDDALFEKARGRLMGSQSIPEESLRRVSDLYQGDKYFRALMIRIGDGADNEAKAITPMVSDFIRLRASGLGEAFDVVSPKLLLKVQKWETKRQDSFATVLKEAADLSESSKNSASPMTNAEAFRAALSRKGIDFEQFKKSCRK